MPDIYWLIAVQRQYLEAMQPRVEPRVYTEDYRMICQRLAATFPDAAAVIVRDRLHGYRNRSDRHILLVEVVHEKQAVDAIASRRPEDQPDGARPAGPIMVGWPEFCAAEEKRLGLETRTSAHIVKIAKDTTTSDGKLVAGSTILRDELTAWESCRPVGMTHDSILMRLRQGAVTASGELLSIIYEDAHHVIGMGHVLSLEDAVLDCCVWGTPKVSSIAILIRNLYERFGADFYNRSRVRSTSEENMSRLQAWKNFKVWLSDWNDTLDPGEQPQLDRIQIRREVLGSMSGKRDFLIDPVDYLRSVEQCPQFCPLLLWGCADGDLHGRNVLVTAVSDEVALPAAFDYADMGLDNLVGWDFVKLETELKVRALPRLHAHVGTWPEYHEAVLRFECHLAAATLAMHNEQEMPRTNLGSHGLQRLAEILLTIRQQARRHLGIQRLRDRQWLEEYYFLLACYGVYASRFDTYSGYPRQIGAAFISAGVAARQLSRPCQRLAELVRGHREDARGKIAIKAFDPGAFLAEKPNGETILDKPRCEMSYHARLAFAQTWVREPKPGDCERKSFIAAAIEILMKLREQYPHALEIEEELALAYLEADDRTKFEGLLDGVTRRYSQVSEEFLCRIGRYWKDRARDARETTDLTSAARFHKAALELYQRAYQLRQHYYPGINVAGLQFVLGKNEEARKTAQAVLASLDQTWPAEQEHWVRATRADAQFLAGNNEQAERLYREAAVQADAHACASSRRQVEMLLEYAPDASRAYWIGEKLDEVFNRQIRTPGGERE